MNDVPGTYEDNRGYLYVSLRCGKAPVATPPATPTAKPTPTPDGRETFEPPNIKTPMPSGAGARKPVPIPDFTGSSPLKAQDWFKRYGLKPAIEERPSDQFARGQIFDQQPAPGTDVYVVKEARLFVSTGPPAPARKPVPIPDFTGSSPSKAQSWFARYGLKPAIDEHPSDQFARGQIFDQQPAPGTDVYVVKDARLFVSTGPPPPAKPTPAPARKPVPIPDFKGSSPLKAQDWFKHYGLKPAIEERPSDQFARGQIFDQQPAAGTDVYVVKDARLFVSAGPPAPARKPVPIPDFRGSSPLKAQDWFARYGLKPAIEERASDQFAQGQIFRSAAGARH